MSHSYFGCVKVPSTDLVSLRAFAHEVQAVEIKGAIEHAQELFWKCLSDAG